MSWHFLQGQEAESWEGSCLDGAPSALLSLIPTAANFSCRDRETECSHDSQSGTMCEHSTEVHGAATLMLSAADFPARTSASPAEGPGSTVQSQDSGWKWPGSFAKWDPVLCLWKTRQRSLVEGLDVFSETWPRWGMMRNGECLELRQPGLRTRSANESGLWPTPTVTGNHNRKGASKNSGDGLATAVKWATPTCHDRKGNSGAKRGRNAQGSECLTEQVGGTLNPTWVEWLMGWPMGWTDLKPLAMGKFRQWLDLHGASCNERTAGDE